jgi:AcrR family transcriptional regulator
MVTAGTAPLSARRQQEHRIVDAVRQLLDEGVEDPSIEEISRRGRMSKAIIYRHVATKEELYLLALCSYQEELGSYFRQVPDTAAPLSRLEDLTDIYVAFCLRYPAYLDCTASLQRYTWAELARRVSPALLQRVTSLIGSTNSRMTAVLVAGREDGTFTVSAPDLDVITHILYTSTMGIARGLRSGEGLRRDDRGHPEAFPVNALDVFQITVLSVHTLIGAPPRTRDVRLDLPPIPPNQD